MTSRVAPFLIVASLAVGLASAATAQDAGLVSALAPEIAKACLAGSRVEQAALPAGLGVISASALGQAIAASKVAKLDYDYGWGRDAPRAISTAAFGNATGDNFEALNLLQRLTLSWAYPEGPNAAAYLPLEAGGVIILSRSGSPVRAGLGPDILTAILGGEAAPYLIGCRRGSPTEPSSGGGAAVTEGGAFVIAKSPDDLAKDLTDKSFAEFAFIDDRAADSQTYSANITAGWLWEDRTYPSAEWRRSSRGWLVRTRPGVFVQYERKGSDTTVDDTETNNLNFGLQAAGFLQTRGPERGADVVSHYFVLDARYLSDDRFEASGWSASASVSPFIDLPGYRTPWRFSSRLEATWLVTAVIDYEMIDDPGRKVELKPAPEFGRLGYDLDAELRFFVSEDRKQAFSLSGAYGLRDDFTNHGGDAQFLSAKLLFEPTPNYMFGVVYERGENLDSLESVEQWKLTFGVRR